MSHPRDVLTPDSLTMLQAIAQTGSFAAAARQTGLVPSALTYRVRQMEDALDVLLFDRSSRQARFTAAGTELLREGARILQEVDALAQRVHRVATGWESQLTLVVDGLISNTTLLEMVEAYYATQAPTPIKITRGIMAGTLEELTSGRADLALGLAVDASNEVGLQQGLMGEVEFILCIAPHHPLAAFTEPLSDEVLLQHRAVAVADTAHGAKHTSGVLHGQKVLTVDSMHSKLQAQLRGIGFGFLPEPIARPYLDAGVLVHKEVQRNRRVVRLSYAWSQHKGIVPGRALTWWLEQLKSALTCKALLENHHF